MQGFTEERKKEIIAALESRGAKNPCPRCGGVNFALIDGYVSHSLQTNMLGMTLGGTTIPTIATVCVQCGFVSQHALGVLGLLPKAEAPK